MRFHLSKVIKTSLMTFLVVFIIMNVHLMFNRTSYNYDNAGDDKRPATFNHQSSKNAIEIVKNLQLGLTSNLDKSTPHMNQSHVQSSSNVASSYVDTANVSLIKSAILDINMEQIIKNKDKFGLRLNEHSIIVIIQVHNRLQYLKLLIDSLRTAQDISQVLVVFSHDFFSNEINTLIQGIDFCPVMQIFYPYPIQVYQKEFPGEDPNDCPRNIKRDRAREVKCNNAEHPDTYGHYREAKYAQTKHHWFWKIHRVFDELKVTRDFYGPVVLLEEDHYVAPDFIPVLRHMYNNRASLCSRCNIFTLGNYDKKPSFQMSNKVEDPMWISSKHNMAMTLDRATWNGIKECTDKFCEFDDYNWDWSLQLISAICLKQKLQAMVVKSPRVFHMGECGVHHKGKNCDPQARLNSIKTLLKDNAEKLFPSSMEYLSQPRKGLGKPKPNGGWGDVRDHALCKSFISDKKQKR